jgi:hypothetical protein
MFKSLKSVLCNVFTEPNNHTICPVRVLGVAGTVQGLGLTAYTVVVHHAPFDITAYGAGMGVMLAALGAALGMKKDTAP